MRFLLKSGIILFCLIFLLWFGAKSVQAAAFDPNFILSDEEYLDSSTMNLADIQLFLQSRSSFLANYTCTNANGVYKSAAEIIYDAAVNNYDCDGVDNGSSLTEEQKKILCKKITINPKLLLVLLQKEQSLIEDSDPSLNQLDWATGYGCPDNQACNTRWKGFGKQINSASLQFYDYLVNPQYYTYKAGYTYTVTNTNLPPSIIIPINQATAALYNYTPHVYNGNFNFYNLWLRYFTRNYTNGALLQVKSEVGVWLIQNAKKRAFLSKGALTSRFDLNKIIQVNKSDLDKYPTGDPIKYAQYSLLRSPRGTVFLIVDDKKRGFVSQEALRKIGYNPEEIINASWDDLNTYEDGLPITATSSYPTGALLQDNKTGGVFYVTEGTKAPIWDKVLLKTKFKYRSITPVSPEKLASYQTVEPAIFNDGELLKSSISPGVYIIDNKMRRPFTSGEIFEKLGYKWSNVITVPKKILDLYPEGITISEIYTEATATSTAESGAASSTPNSTLNGTASSTNNDTSTSTAGINEEIKDIINPGS